MAKQQQPKEHKHESHVVTQEFRDIANWDTLYEVGQDVSELNEERLAVLVEKGLVKKA